MHKHINEVTNVDCPTCDAKLTLRQNKKAKTLFLGCQTYQTSRCPGSLPLTDALVIAIRTHFKSLSQPRQLSLLEKGHRKAYLTLRYEVYDGGDDDCEVLLEVGEAELSYDNLVLKPADIAGMSIFIQLLEHALSGIALDEE